MQLKSLRGTRDYEAHKFPPVFYVLSNYFSALEKQIFPSLKFNFDNNRNKTTDFLDIKCEGLQYSVWALCLFCHIYQ